MRNMGQRMMVIAAHMGDFVWRCGGSIAKYTEEGNEVLVLVLSSGIRGEANDYWAKEGANMEAGISERLSEGKRAAGELGVKNFEFWDLPDYPMPIGAGHGLGQFHVVVQVREGEFRLDHPELGGVAVRITMPSERQSEKHMRPLLEPVSRTVFRYFQDG